MSKKQNQNPQPIIQHFRINGSFKEKGSFVKFSRDVRSMNPEDAKEKIFAHFGSKHKLKRLSIQIHSIDVITKKDASKLNETSIAEADFKLIRG